jgi:hypothetical protein
MASKHIGNYFDDFLAEDGRLEEATATAMKRVTAWQKRTGNKSIEAGDDNHEILLQLGRLDAGTHE